MSAECQRAILPRCHSLYLGLEPPQTQRGRARRRRHPGPGHCIAASGQSCPLPCCGLNLVCVPPREDAQGAIPGSCPHMRMSLLLFSETAALSWSTTQLHYFLNPSLHYFLNPSVHTMRFEHRDVATVPIHRVKSGFAVQLFQPLACLWMSEGICV